MRSRKRGCFEKHGDLFFITFTVAGFTPIFRYSSCCDVLLDNLRFYQERGDFTILAYVIMPNHVHLILKTHDKCSISQCIGNLKRITSRQLSARLSQIGAEALIDKLRDKALKEPAHDCRVWKPRFDCLVLNNLDTLSQKIQYIHNNPVRAGLVDSEVDWSYSSARAYAGLTETGLRIDKNWRSLSFDQLRSGKGS